MELVGSGQPVTAWIVDIDGTLAVRGNRGPFEWHRVGEDYPNLAVRQVVQALAMHPNVGILVAVTGREECSRRQTILWLDAQNVPFGELHMREDGDYRSDEVVKEQIYRDKIDGRLAVLGVLDDRTRVVAMWRRLGLVCLQVAEGDF